MNDPRMVIAALREGQGLSDEGAALMARGLADGTLSDAQAGAFAMAVLLCGAETQGRVALTRAMRDSGHVLRWDLPGPVVDKHSTGGIGDTVSLILAPVLAACGVFVPMISGRGLGHTGGTLDKLEAIPGLRCDLAEDRFRSIIADVGCAIVSASGNLAPADRRLYAIRDDTATVQSVDLITASILSKKLAAGLDALVLDVKVGTGAFMQSDDDARALAHALVETANEAGCRTGALITDMDQPLARAAGNALEVAEAITVLRGGQGALRDLTLILCEACLELVGVDTARAARALDDGAAAERFARMVAAQGGNAAVLDDPALLPRAALVRPVHADAPTGYVTAMDATALGRAVVALGGGRQHRDDRIDPTVGLAQLVRLGQEVGRGQPLAMIHARTEAQATTAARAVQAAIQLGERTETGPLVRERMMP